MSFPVLSALGALPLFGFSGRRRNAAKADARQQRQPSAPHHTDQTPEPVAADTASDSFFQQDEFVFLDAEIANPDRPMGYQAEDEKLVFVHDYDTPPPTLSVRDNGDGTQSLCANGKTVAIVKAPTLSVSDVAIVRREADNVFTV